MKKFLILIISIICAFAVALVGCLEPLDDPAADNQTNVTQPDDKDTSTEDPTEDPAEDPDDNEDGDGNNGGNTDPDPDGGDNGGNGGQGGDQQNPDDNKDGDDDKGGNNGGNTDPDPDDGNNGEDEKGEVKPHECTYSDSWSKDLNNHWRESTCPDHPNVTFLRAPHTFSNGTCSVCGQEQPKPSSTPSSSLSGTYNVGDKVPYFSFQTFNSSYQEGTYDTANAAGKVLIINFWYVTCGVCVDEMPDVEELKTTYGDDVVVIALHKDNGEPAQSKINSSGWSNYKTIFGLDANDAVYNTCGIKGFDQYPITLVIGKDGTLVYKCAGSFMWFNMEPPYGYTNVLTPIIEAELKK